MVQQQIIANLKGIPDGKTILVATSAGVDSMALLHLLSLQGIKVVACYVNHLQRIEEAKRESHCVSAFCKSRGIPFFYKEIDYSKNQKVVENKQHFFRNERYRLLLEVATTENIDYIATAHHIDDQAETIFMRMVKDYSPTSFSGILQKRLQGDVQIIRPLLDISKDSLIAYCQQHNIVYCNDSSNQEDVYFRNNIRNNVFPILKKENKQFAKQFVDSMTLFQELYTDAYQKIVQDLQLIFQKAQLNRLVWSDIADYYETKSYQYQYLVLTVIIEVFFEIDIQLNQQMMQQVSQLVGTDKQKIEIRKHEFLGKQYGYFYYEKDEPNVLIHERLQIGKSIIGNYIIECTYDSKNDSEEQNILFVENLLQLEQLAVKTVQLTDEMEFGYGHKKIRRLYIDEKILPMDRKNALGIYDRISKSLLVDFVTGKKSKQIQEENVFDMSEKITIRWEKVI